MFRDKINLRLQKWVVLSNPQRTGLCNTTDNACMGGSAI